MFGGQNNQNQQDSRNTNRENEYRNRQERPQYQPKRDSCGTLLTILAIGSGYKYQGYILFDISLTLEDEASAHRRGRGTPANYGG